MTAADHDDAARFFAAVMGLEHTGAHRQALHFVPILVNEELTLDFMTVAHPQGHRLAFDVDAVTFDTVVERLDAREISYGDDPAHADSGRIDHPHPHGGRGVHFSDASGNLYELISP